MASVSISTPAPPHDLCGPVSLALFKLSHCTTSTPGAHLLWTHLPNRDDMFAVFDFLRKKDFDGTVSEKKVLKLVRAGELLEQIELDTLRHQVRLDEERARVQVVKEDHMYVLIIVKKPLLALRYQLPDGQIRRIQMNFQPSSGFDIAFNTFRSMGIPIKEKSQIPQTRIHSASQVAQSQSQDMIKPLMTAYGNLMPSAARPAASQYDSQQNVNSVYNSTKLSWVLKDDMTVDSFSKPISYIQDPRTQFDMLHENRHFSEHADIRPSSASNVSHTGSHQVSGHVIGSGLHPSPAFSTQALSNGYDIRPTSAPEVRTPQLLTDSMPMGTMLPPRRELPFPNRPEKPSSQETPILSAPTMAETAKVNLVSATAAIHGATINESASKRKVATAVAAQSARAKNAKLVCPDCGRKDLKNATGLLLHGNSQHNRNFKSVDEAIEASVRGHSVEGQNDAIVTCQKLPKAQRRLQAPSSSAPKPRIRKAAPKSRIPDTPPPSSAPPKLNSTCRPSARRSSDTDRSPPSIAKSPTPQPKLPKRNKRPLEISNSNQACRSGVEQQQGLTMFNITPSEYMDSLEGWIRKHQDLPGPRPAQTAKEQLALYAKQSDRDRSRAIDEMICECLEDENFIKLAEDVEGAWKRIGLGF